MSRSMDVRLSRENRIFVISRVCISAQSSTEDHVSSTSITFQPHYRVKPTSVSLLQGLPFRWYLSQYPGDMAAITPIAEPAPAAGGQNGEET
jgi:hypothetical protein